MEQVRLFNDANIFIAVHGAALTNLMWMMPNITTVVETLVDHGWSVYLIKQQEQCQNSNNNNDNKDYYMKFDYFNLVKLWSMHRAHMKTKF